MTVCAGTAQKSSAPSPSSQARQDPLSRTTPRGSVLGFLNAASKGNFATAVDTRKRGEKAEELADQLFVVLDRRLPAKLNELSDQPEGSLSYPNDPDLELGLPGVPAKRWRFPSKD